MSQIFQGESIEIFVHGGIEVLNEKRWPELVKDLHFVVLRPMKTLVLLINSFCVEKVIWPWVRTFAIEVVLRDAFLQEKSAILSGRIDERIRLPRVQTLNPGRVC